MLAGFFDDSGKESNPRGEFVCLAGYVAGDMGWTDFVALWGQLLLKHGIPYLHMKDFVPLQGPYKQLGWSISKRNEVLSDFIAVIKDTNLIGVGVSVHAQAWRTVVPEELARQHGNAMEFCFQRVCRLIVDRMKKVAPRELLGMYFDCDEEFSAARFRLFSWVRQHNETAREYISSITFANPLHWVGLQAADFLAWQTRKEMLQKLGGFDSTAQWKELFALDLGYVPEYIGEAWTKLDIEDKVIKPWREANA
jgi:hypothetical protein